MLHYVVNKFWIGENRNPVNINDRAAYNGMARYVVDTTPILEDDFYTSFNTGHSHYWFKYGKKVSSQDWNARSVQDVLPTWTWWMKSDKNTRFNTYYDFENVKARYLVVEAADSTNYWIKISDFMFETFDIVDKSLLIETIDAANDLDREGKTPESIEKLEEAIDKAQAVIDKDG